MRARFVGPDGLSFFCEIDESRPVISRFAKRDDDAYSLQHIELIASSVQVEHYRREYWNIPIGPLACPTYYGINRFGEPRTLDVVYRYEGS